MSGNHADFTFFVIAHPSTPPLNNPLRRWLADSLILPGAMPRWAAAAVEKRAPGYQFRPARIVTVGSRSDRCRGLREGAHIDVIIQEFTAKQRVNLGVRMEMREQKGSIRTKDLCRKRKGWGGGELLCVCVSIKERRGEVKRGNFVSVCL